MVVTSMLGLTDVYEADGDYYAFVKGTYVRLRRDNGDPLPLSEGWTPESVVVGLPNISVLILRHVSGERSRWFLDRNYSFATIAVDRLPEAAQADLRSAFPKSEHFTSDVYDGLPRLPSDPVDLTSDNALFPNAYLDGKRIFKDITVGQVREYGEFWRKNDYLHVKDILSEEIIPFFDEGITFSDGEAADDPRQFYRTHHDKSSSWIISGFHMAAQQLYEAILSTKVMRMAAFAMRYTEGSDLLPHYDNIFTGISSTVCYRNGPNGKRCPLYIDKAKFLNPYQQRLTVADKAGIPEKNIAKIDLSPGDFGMFRGRTHLHWRETIIGELDCRAILVHFSESGYKSELRRPEYVADIPRYLVDMDSYTEFRIKYASYFETGGQDWI